MRSSHRLLPLLFATALEAQELTLDRVASFPNLSGTAPSSPEWSGDGTHVAFLWNENGMPFRDLYVVAASGDRPTRVTNVATEQGGISDLVWAPDGESLFYSFSGGVYEVRRDGTGLERRVAPPGGKSSLAFSPDGKILAYLEEGDLYLWHRATSDLVRATKVARSRIGNGPLDTCCGPGFSRPDVELTSLSWSPDSRRIALVLRRPQRGSDHSHPQLPGGGDPRRAGETRLSRRQRSFAGPRDLLRRRGPLPAPRASRCVRSRASRASTGLPTARPCWSISTLRAPNTAGSFS